jgi:4-alpha-glucanotransferase
MSTGVPRLPILDHRRAGILLHPSSLPGGDPLGELGPDAFRFVEFLAAAGISVWQVLPLGPTHDDLSPYMSLSVHAGNPRLISLVRLREWGWLSDDTVGDRHRLLAVACAGFEAHAGEDDRQAFAVFCDKHQFWLDDFACYQALRRSQHDRSWAEWPQPLRDRNPKALRKARTELAGEIAQACFEQFVFFRQWGDIRRYAGEQGIRLFGDMPIFVAHDSAEVWARRDYFDLDDDGQPRTVAGVPPDYFSDTGQLWGNPHYRWDHMAEDGYRWWIERLQTALEMFDLLRIDHFRGFEAYWEIPAGAKTAIEGRWMSGPGMDFFEALLAEFPHLPLVAEDLGVITPAVEQLRDQYDLPGMKILQFAFDGGADNPYLPHNHPRNAVVYTGTHDNDTTLGWFNGLDADTQHYMRRYLTGGLTENNDTPMPWALIRAALISPARLAVVPMQDLLELGGQARMNTPAQAQNNWRWRFRWEQVPAELAGCLAKLVDLYGRRTHHE